MKSVKVMLLGASLLMLSACGPQVQKESEATVTEKSNSEAIIETILSRRSVRKYKPEAVNRDTMKVILECGINAPQRSEQTVLGGTRSRQPGIPERGK